MVDIPDMAYLFAARALEVAKAHSSLELFFFAKVICPPPSANKKVTTNANRWLLKKAQVGMLCSKVLYT